MVHRHGKLAVALAVVALLGGTALAQQRPFGGFGGGTARLLMNPDGQQELKLSEEQSTKAKEIGQQIREKHKDDFAKLKETPKEQVREKFQELAKVVNAETEKALKDVLKPEQQKRLKQLELQARGVDAFTDSEIQTSLKLTDEQKEKIKTLNEDARKEMREIFQNAQGNFQEALPKVTALRK